jgi:hypothetical protein
MAILTRDADTNEEIIKIDDVMDTFDTKANALDGNQSKVQNASYADSAGSTTTATHHLGRHEQDGYALYAPKESDYVQRIRDNGGRAVAVDYADSAGYAGSAGSVDINSVVNILKNKIRIASSPIILSIGSKLNGGTIVGMIGGVYVEGDENPYRYIIILD